MSITLHLQSNRIEYCFILHAAQTFISPAPDHEDPQALQLSLLLWIRLGVFLFLVTLLLLIGLLRCRKQQTSTNVRGT